jgi:hypothetical protein
VIATLIGTHKNRWRSILVERSSASQSVIFAEKERNIDEENDLTR